MIIMSTHWLSVISTSQKKLDANWQLFGLCWLGKLLARDSRLFEGCRYDSDHSCDAASCLKRWLAIEAKKTAPCINDHKWEIFDLQICTFHKIPISVQLCIASLWRGYTWLWKVGSPGNTPWHHPRSPPLCPWPTGNCKRWCSWGCRWYCSLVCIATKTRYDVISRIDVLEQCMCAPRKFQQGLTCLLSLHCIDFVVETTLPGKNSQRVLFSACYSLIILIAYTWVVHSSQVQ